MSEQKTRVLTDQNGHTLRVIDNEFCALQDERDSLVAQNNALRIALDDMLEDMQVGAELSAEDCAQWKAKIMLLLSKSPQHHLSAHDAEVTAKAVLDYNMQLRKDLDDKLPVHCIGVHGDEYAAKLLAKAGA